jgi:hypothetical protein
MNAEETIKEFTEHAEKMAKNLDRKRKDPLADGETRGDSCTQRIEEHFKPFRASTSSSP